MLGLTSWLLKRAESPRLMARQLALTRPPPGRHNNRRPKDTKLLRRLPGNRPPSYGAPGFTPARRIIARGRARTPLAPAEPARREPGVGAQASVEGRAPFARWGPRPNSLKVLQRVAARLSRAVPAWQAAFRHSFLPPRPWPGVHSCPERLFPLRGTAMPPPPRRPAPAAAPAAARPRAPGGEGALRPGRAGASPGGRASGSASTTSGTAASCRPVTSAAHRSTSPGPSRTP
jgi:hypothetical protein